jgi:hypothetical protein
VSTSTFSPGFRISAFDIVILCAGLTGSIIVYRQAWWSGWAVAFVVLHFFLFCNVFRIARAPELVWATTFIALAALTILTKFPGWVATTAITFALSSLLIWRETKMSNYHGIFWQKWNPSLPDYWAAHRDIAGPSRTI